MCMKAETVSGEIRPTKNPEYGNFPFILMCTKPRFMHTSDANRLCDR